MDFMEDLENILAIELANSEHGYNNCADAKKGWVIKVLLTDVQYTHQSLS